jgi:hypothetical protein
MTRLRTRVTLTLADLPGGAFHCGMHAAALSEGRRYFAHPGAAEDGAHR